MTVSKAKHIGTETYFFPRSAGNIVVKYCTEFASVCVCQQSLCAECRSDTFFHCRFQLIVLGLQLADQGAADEVLFRSLRDESGGA